MTEPQEPGMEHRETECPLCHGSGELGGSVCEACGGYGTVYRSVDAENASERGGRDV